VLRDLYEALGAGVLFLTAGLALFAWYRTRETTDSNFSLVAGIGTLFLAVDEALDLHVRLGSMLYDDRGVGKPPGVNHIDDALVVAIGIAGLAVIALFRHEILRDRDFARLLGAGLVLFAAAIVVDARAPASATFAWWTEETLELAGALAMFLAFGLRLRRTLNSTGGRAPGVPAVPRSH